VTRAAAALLAVLPVLAGSCGGDPSCYELNAYDLVQSCDFAPCIPIDAVDVVQSLLGNNTCPGPAPADIPGNVCSAMLDDSLCATCAKEQCCAEATACLRLQTCWCWVTCERRADLESCQASCPTGAGPGGLYICLADHCCDQCALVAAPLAGGPG
jgi:hypothetical protein